jgi:carbonic anhydrase
VAEWDFLGNWLQLLAPVAAEVGGYATMTEGEKRTALERISIRHSIANLRTFPFVKAAEDAGRLALHGAWFDISSGELWVMDVDSGDFVRPEY